MDTVPFNWNNLPPIYKEVEYVDKEGNVVGRVWKCCCPECGEVIKRSNKYCTNCGLKLKEDTNA